MDKMEQKATIVALKDDDNRIGRFRDHRFMRGFKAVEVALDGDSPRGLCEAATLVDLRIYRAESGATFYACLWLQLPADSSSPDRYRYACGSGAASGWGYDKESAAAAEAFERAGIALSQRIDGVGIEALEEALRAVADLADRPYIVARCEA